MLRAAAPGLLFSTAIACGAGADGAAGPEGTVFDNDGRGGGDSGASGNGSGGGGLDINGSGGGNTGGSGAGNGVETCAAEKHEGERVPANLLFVVDRSGSMKCNLPPLQSSAECEATPVPKDQAEESKWIATKAALNGALDALKAQGDVRVGVSMFPRDKKDGEVDLKCHVESQPSVAIEDLTDAHRDGLTVFFDNSWMQGSTPLAGATILGYKHLHDQFAGEGRKFLVLITDGIETCAQDTTYPEDLKNHYVPGALSVGIQTFVIGVPGSEGGREDLSTIAYEGGTASSATCDDAAGDAEVCHFDLTDSSTDLTTDLEAALGEIRNSLISCELKLPEAKDAAVDATQVIVLVNDEHALEDNSGPCEDGVDGWQYNAARDGIILCGSACEGASEPDATVEIGLGCPPPQ